MDDDGCRNCLATVAPRSALILQALRSPQTEALLGRFYFRVSRVVGTKAAPHG